jgi:hypothetical protein
LPQNINDHHFDLPEIINLNTAGRASRLCEKSNPPPAR